MKLIIKSIYKQDNIYSRRDNVIVKTDRKSSFTSRLEYPTNSAARRAMNEFNIGGK